MQTGVYAQDQWAPTTRLTLTGGLRIDVPFLTTKPDENPDVLQAFGVSTARTPSGHLLWSPRLGVNYALANEGTSFLRGGIGLFEGPPSYTWLENAYSGNGLQRVELFCAGDNVPAFTLQDPQPTECASESQPTPVITVFDPSFRFTQNLKISLGFDQRLPWNVVGTVDLLYTRGINQFGLRDLNLLPPTGASAGEGGRPLYGTIDPASGVSTTNLRDTTFSQVVQIINRSGDRAYSLAFQLQKRLRNGNEIGLAYTYTDAKNREDTPTGGSFDNLAVTVVDGTRENPSLRTSLYELPHMLRFHAALDLPLKVRLGLVYLASSGFPFSYVVVGDPNADGLGARGRGFNDAVYVPKDANDISLVDDDGNTLPASSEEYSRLDRFIQSQPCLRTQRGHVLQRNSCRDLWSSELDARLTKALPIVGGHTLELSADLFNVLNFLDRDWGLKYSIGGGINYGQFVISTWSGMTKR